MTTNESLIGWLRRSSRTMAGIAAMVTLTFVTLVTAPSLAAARQMWEEGLPKAAASPGPSVEAQFSRTVIKLKRHLERMAERLAREQGPPDWVVFKQLRGELERLDRDIRQRFDQLEEHIERRGLPSVILERHLAAVARYEAAFQRLAEELSAIADAEDEQQLQTAVQTVIEHLASVQLEASHQPFDPSNLPFGTPQTQPGRPGDSGKALAARLSGKAAASTRETASSTRKAAPSARDLAETEDIRLTPAIQSKAAELGHEPVAIYNWVRNHVEFIPSYGAIQGADQTLALKRGNAFDTASLLIALLRASDVPARYAYGTVTVPADQVMNWVGGVAVPEAALNLLGQGGIPNQGLTQNGVITHIRFEHVWVEAWVDYEPSRGAIHDEGDTWISLDASFKQYEDQAGMDLAESVPFDAQGFADQLERAATVNEAEGWVQNVDQSLIESELAAYQAAVEDYVNAQDPDATVGEVLGTRTIIPQTLPVLPASLPYELEAHTDAFSALPDRLRHKVTFKLSDTGLGLDASSLIFVHTTSLAQLAYKRISLTYPAN